MEIRQLKYFVAAVEAGAISRAATRCGVTQPSLSQQIMKLEDQIGEELLDRVGRGVVLTEAGRALLPRAKRILALVREAEANLLSDVEDGRDSLAIGAIPTIAPYILPALVADLRNEFPECELIVREDLTPRLVEAIADNEIDLAVMSTPPAHDLIQTRVVGHEPMSVVVPEDHPLCVTPDVSMPELRKLPAVTLHEMHCLGQQLSEFCAAKRLAGNVVCRMTQIETLLEFVRLGLGISIVPDMVASHSPREGLRFLPFKRNPPSREITIVTHAGRRKSRLARRFAELLHARVNPGPS